MTPEELKINKDAAEFLGWRERCIDSTTFLYVHIDGLHSYRLENMRFHDSEDWVALLVEKCNRFQIYQKIAERLRANNHQTEAPNVISWWIGATPMQKAELCLEVLGG